MSKHSHAHCSEYSRCYAYATSNVLLHFLVFFNDPAPPEIYTLSLHDALPISHQARQRDHVALAVLDLHLPEVLRDRKSTRLNSSHANISYAVFCLKKKKIINDVCSDT